MSDAAFKTGAYPAYTIDELKAFVAEGREPSIAAAMTAEIARRDRVAAGDVSAMTPGERLRHSRNN